MKRYVDKPPYKVPSMSEIRAIEPNSYNVVSTFSGCGGSCLGFEMAGYRILYASEFVESARETYKRNHQGVFVDDRDIRQVSASDIMLKLGIERGQLDVLEGSPPCASFSTAGARHKHWGKVKSYSDKKQRTDDLFFEFTRILDGLYPKVFVAENVSGLVKGKAKGYFLDILKELRSKGYNVKAQLLNAKWLGVPQSRERLIFVGVRNDLSIGPAFPKPLSYSYSLREAFDSLPYEHDAQAMVLRDAARKHIKGWYGVLKKIPKNPNRVIKGAHVMDGSYFNLSRLSWHLPSDTICQMNGQPSKSGNCHPEEDRKLTICELKRVCGFPDDFELLGDFAQQWERLGRAVPPVMMYQVANTVQKEILDKIGRP